MPKLLILADCQFFPSKLHLFLTLCYQGYYDCLAFLVNAIFWDKNNKIWQFDSEVLPILAPSDGKSSHFDFMR